MHFVIIMKNTKNISLCEQLQGDVFNWCPLGRGNKPPVQPGEDKKALAKKTSEYNGKCLTTHYQKYKEVFHNEKE